MKKSINAWSVEEKLGFEEMFAVISKSGFDGIELNVDAPGKPHGLSMQTTDEDYNKIRALSEKYSLPVVSISTSLSGSMSGIPEKWDNYRALIRKQIEAAQKLSAKGILTVPGGMSDTVTLDMVRKNSIEFYKSMKQEIEDSGIFVGLENVWNGFFLSPYDMKSFIDEVGSKSIGAYYDTGNSIAFSQSEYWADVLKGYIGCVHIKDFKREGGINSGGCFCNITEGSGNWAKIIPALKAGGFDGYLTAEVFEKTPDMTYEEYYAMVAKQIATVIAYE